MDTPQDFPQIDPALVSALDTVFPERCPEVEDSDRHIWLYVGKREVVRFLQAKLAEQQESQTILRQKRT